MLDMIDVSWMLTSSCFVYVLYVDDLPVYVGQTKNIGKRIAQHRSRTKISQTFYFNKIKVIPCSPDKVDFIEYETIRDLKPTMNKTFSSSVSYKGDFSALGIELPRPRGR